MATAGDFLFRNIRLELGKGIHLELVETTFQP